MQSMALPCDWGNDRSIDTRPVTIKSVLVREKQQKTGAFKPVLVIYEHLRSLKWCPGLESNQ